MEHQNERIRPRLSTLIAEQDLPNRVGLFGTKLSVASVSMLQPTQKEEYDWQKVQWPYDYMGDVEYVNLMHDLRGHISGMRYNLDIIRFLSRNGLTLLPEFMFNDGPGGPKRAPEPEWRSPTAYIWPSYIIWINDPSFVAFSGVPDNPMELPKHVLRATTGHPEFRDEPRHSYRPRLQTPGRII